MVCVKLISRNRSREQTDTKVEQWRRLSRVCLSKLIIKKEGSEKIPLHTKSLCLHTKKNLAKILRNLQEKLQDGLKVYKQGLKRWELWYVCVVFHLSWLLKSPELACKIWHGFSPFSVILICNWGWRNTVGRLFQPEGVPLAKTRRKQQSLFGGQSHPTLLVQVLELAGVLHWGRGK